MTDGIKSTITDIYQVMFGLTIRIFAFDAKYKICVILTLPHFKDEGQDCAHFYCEYLANGKNRANITIAIIHDVAYCLSIRIFRFDLSPFYRSRSRSRSCTFRPRFSVMVTDRANITLAFKHDVASGILIIIFRVDFGLFKRST